jgi:putative inorganic carbon (HCO3(-)) transporter
LSNISPLDFRGYDWLKIIGAIGVLQYLFSLCITINPNIPLILLSISCAFVGNKSHQFSFSYKSVLILCIFGFFVSLVISSIFALDISKSLFLIFSYFPSILLFFLIVELFNISFCYLVFLSFTIISLIISSTSLIIYITSNSSNPQIWINEISNFYIVVPNDLVIVSILIPYSTVLALKKPKSVVGMISIISILAALASVVIYKSRTGMVCSLVSISCVVLFLSRRRLVDIGIASVAFLILVDWVQGFEIINKVERIWQSRLFIWITGLAMFTDSPWLGHGPRSFGQLYLPYRNSLNLPDWILVDNRWMPWAHNLYLEIMVEQGLIGILCFLGMIIFGFLSILQSLRNGMGDIRILSAGVFASFMSIVVAAFFELTFIRHYFIVIFFSVFALIHAISCFNDRGCKKA